MTDLPEGWRLWSLGELRSYCESPEGKAEARLSEKHYRRGYWDGVERAIRYLRIGAERRQVEDWFGGDLRRWNYRGNYDDCEMPPAFVPWKLLRAAVLSAHDNICAYCGEHATHVDHVVPVAQGGGYEPDNLVAACADCNTFKNRYRPEEKGMTIKYPRTRVVVIEYGYDEANVLIIP